MDVERTVRSCGLVGSLPILTLGRSFKINMLLNENLAGQLFEYKWFCVWPGRGYKQNSSSYAFAVRVAVVPRTFVGELSYHKRSANAAPNTAVLRTKISAMAPSLGDPATVATPKRSPDAPCLWRILHSDWYLVRISFFGVFMFRADGYRQLQQYSE